MSTTAPDVVSVTQLVAHPGVSPSITVPMLGTVAPDVDDLWAHLAEPADFFGVAMPSRADLADALHAFLESHPPAAPVTAVTVIVVAGESRAVVIGIAIRPIHSDAVRIDRCDVDTPLAGPGDPHWRRMAARTTSGADRDQLRRWLADRGFADAVSTRGAPVPFLGALVYQRGSLVLGIDNPEPTSVLDQLQRCGAIRGVTRTIDGPAEGDTVWWLSPDYELHPVSAIGDTEYRTSGDTPTFASLS